MNYCPNSGTIHAICPVIQMKTASVVAASKMKGAIPLFLPKNVTHTSRNGHILPAMAVTTATAAYHSPYRNHPLPARRYSQEVNPKHNSPSISRQKEDAKAPLLQTGTGRKTQAQLDEELRVKLESMSGDGGAAGVEYENGRAEGLKRGVKQNMFRVI